MDRGKLIDDVKQLASECEEDHPYAASVLLALSGSLMCGLEGEFSSHTAKFSKAAIQAIGMAKAAATN